MDKDTWDAITAIGTVIAALFTAIMAVVTGIMAWFTRQAVQEGQDQRRESNAHFEKSREQDKEHHQDVFRPLLVLVPPGDGAPSDRKDLVKTTNSEDADPAVYVKCAVHNIGVGPAVNIKLSVRKDGVTGFGPSRELAPIAANEHQAGKDDRIRLPVIYHKQFNKIDLANLHGNLWILVLEYEDVFGNKFHTLHPKDRGALWTHVGRGSAPDTTPDSYRPAPKVAAELDVGDFDQPGNSEIQH